MPSMSTRFKRSKLDLRGHEQYLKFRPRPRRHFVPRIRRWGASDARLASFTRGRLAGASAGGWLREGGPAV
eukprot:4948397-Alexandrium_andersonii.AAC.1